MEHTRHHPPAGQSAPTGSWLELLGTARSALRRASTRFSQWVEENQEGIEQILEGIAVMAAIQPKLEELWERWGDDLEWGFLIWQLDFINGFALMLLLDESAEEPVIDFLEMVLTDPIFVEEVRAEMDQAPLAKAQRRQLDIGLGYVERRDYEVAVPLLIVALEGAFVGEAERRQLVEQAKGKIKFTEASGKSGTVGGVEDIFRPLGLNEHLDSFLRRQVYGSRGNEFRHGTAKSGWREKTLSLTIALTACLDLMSEREGTLLVNAFARHDEGMEIAQRQLQTVAPSFAPRRAAFAHLQGEGDDA